MYTDSAQRRWVEFAEIDNARDLGGLPVISGGTTRFGVVYRSSTPQQLSEADLGLLVGRLGLRTVVDLRNPDEAEREGHGRLVGTAVRLVNLPVRKADQAEANPAELVPGGHEDDLIGLYRDLLTGSTASMVSAVRLIADVDHHSVVFHCAAGKDRTGIMAAMLLDAVGVPAEAIAADYGLTAERMERIRTRLDALPSYHGLPPLSTGILAVHPEVIVDFLTDLHSTHGGADQWLLANGLTTDELTRLREVLIDR
ncbi:tyrosine-protein phosphatase [Nocardia sp. NPDC052566]|uniref:tyrosine-protein phosphatase n=1 Tax=Nocardia sp. NPDC052566 TaxID=3364330 RepID=UPI0037C61ED7